MVTKSSFRALLRSVVRSTYTSVTAFMRAIVLRIRMLAAWAKAIPIGFVTLLLALATFLVALESHQQLTVMQIDQRPWVSVTPVAKVTLADWNGDKSIDVHLSFTLHNYGRLPAQELRIEPMITQRPDNAHLDDLDKPQDDLCSTAMRAPISQRLSTTVFPGRDATAETAISVGRQYLYVNSVLYEVYGCIDYIYSDGAHGQTLFRYMLGKIDHREGIWMGLPFKMGSRIVKTPYGSIRLASLHKNEYDFGIDQSGGNYVR